MLIICELYFFSTFEMDGLLKTYYQIISKLFIIIVCFTNQIIHELYLNYSRDLFISQNLGHISLWIKVMME